jgi:putative transposase
MGSLVKRPVSKRFKRIKLPVSCHRCVSALIPGAGCSIPYIPKQRCWADKLRNVANRIRRKDQIECLSEAKKIYLAGNRLEALMVFKNWKERWGKNYPEAIKCLEKSLDELLNFLNCPLAHRVKIRTTNVIERSFREVRRRTRTISCFINGASVDRIIFGVIDHLNKNWKDKPILKFTRDLWIGKGI